MDLLEQLLGAGNYGAVDRCEPRFNCHCDSDRVVRAATLLGKDEIRKIVKSHQKRIVTQRCTLDV